MWNPTNKKRPSPTHVVIAGCKSAVFCQCRTELYKCPSVPSFGKNNKNKKEFRVYLYEFNVMTIIPGRREGGRWNKNLLEAKNRGGGVHGFNIYYLSTRPLLLNFISETLTNFGIAAVFKNSRIPNSENWLEPPLKLLDFSPPTDADRRVDSGTSGNLNFKHN